MTFTSFSYRTYITIFSLLVFLFYGSLTEAAPLVHVTDPEGKSVRIVQTTPFGRTNRAEDLTKAISFNLSLLPLLKEIPGRAIPGGSAVSAPNGQGVDFMRFATAGADLLITSNWLDSSSVEIRCFEVTEGRWMFGNRYEVKSGSEGTYDVADAFCAHLLDAIIGNGDFFRSNMAFIRTAGPRQKDVWTMQPNGRHLRRISNMNGEALSPSWSPNGRYVIFTHINNRGHGLGVWDASKNSTQRIQFPGNTVIGPAFMPDNRVAVSLTDGRNPSIFLLNHNFKKERKLDNSTAIDVSPSVDASGNKMAFTSNRYGNPNIFLKDLRSGAVTRITYAGKYNTDPSISPDGTVIAFARQMGGVHRIFAYDLVSNTERQISFGPGSDEQPSFAPDSYFIAFMSTRSGQKQIYMTTRNGGDAIRLPTGPGDASFPAWGALHK